MIEYNSYFYLENQFFSNSQSKIYNLILEIINYSLKLGHMQKPWKYAKIIMIHEMGKPKQEFSSYRPIFLLNWAINILPPEQSDFSSKRSCQAHILRLTQPIINGFNDHHGNKLTGAGFFDLEKAFDEAPHFAILNNCWKVISGFSENWIIRLKSNQIKINLILFKVLQEWKLPDFCWTRGIRRFYLDQGKKILPYVR